MPIQMDAETLVAVIGFAGIVGPVVAALLLVLYIARTTMLEGKGRQ